MNGVLEEHGSSTPAPAKYYRWEMDAFGNDLPGGNDFLAMDQPGPKEHLTGKMFDTITGLYYLHARWYDAEVGRFVSRDPIRNLCDYEYLFCMNVPTLFSDATGLKSSSNFQFDDCCKEWFVDKRISFSSIQNKLDDWIIDFASKYAATFGKEARCMQNKEVEVTCHKCNTTEYCGYKNPGSSTIHICSDMMDTPKGIADTAIHEKAHICGWGSLFKPHPNEDPWKDVPTASIEKADPCDDQIPRRDHPNPNY